MYGKFAAIFGSWIRTRISPADPVPRGFSYCGSVQMRIYITENKFFLH